MGLQDRHYYREDSDSRPWSPTSSGGVRSMVVTLIIINVVIFLLDMFSTDIGKSHWLSDFLALKPGELFAAPWKVWNFLSYGFAHASVNSKDSIFHVGGNMLILFILGRPIEQRLGRFEFLKFYLIAILVAAFGYTLLNFNSVNPMVGASGAVSAVVALFIFFYPHETLLLFGVFPIRAWILGVALVGMDLFRSLNPESHVAWEAHLAGFAFGAAYFYWKLDFQWLQLEKIAKMFKSKPNLKIHKPDRSEKLKQEADRILEKINEQGEESLSARERGVLKKFSKQLRNDRD